MTKNKTRGSVLIFILLAVALLGALTVILSRTSSNTEETGASERDMITATELLRDGAYFKSVIDRLLLSGCSIHEITFQSEAIPPGLSTAKFRASGTYGSSLAPADQRCHIFETAGGGISISNTIPPFRGANTYYDTYDFSGHIRTSYHGTLPKFELTMVTSIMTKSLCLAVNKIAGVVDPSATPWALAGSVTYEGYNDDFRDQNAAFQYSPMGDIRVKGKQAFCISQHARQPPEHYLFVYILHTR